MQQSKDKEREDQDKRIRENMGRIKYRLIVLSGKGGVGKTSVAVNLAFELSRAGHQVGIVDIDLHGPNIAKMLGVEKCRMDGSESMIHAVEVYPGLKAVSTGLLGWDADAPMIWRGPKKTAVIRQFLSDVDWGDLDFLIIDSPPGTGDEPLSACQLIPGLTGAIIVTTPQDVAVMDARKTISFARELGIPVLGIVENMSGFVCPCCKNEIDLFKKGGGEKASSALGVPFLGRIPFAPEIVEFSDAGNSFIGFNKESVSAKAFLGVVENLGGVLRLKK